MMKTIVNREQFEIQNAMNIEVIYYNDNSMQINIIKQKQGNIQTYHYNKILSLDIISTILYYVSKHFEYELIDNKLTDMLEYYIVQTTKIVFTKNISSEKDIESIVERIPPYNIPLNFKTSNIIEINEQYPVDIKQIKLSFNVSKIEGERYE